MAVKGLGLGGTEKLIAEGARFWDRDRFDYHVAYLLPWKNQLVPVLKESGVPVHLLGDRRSSMVTAGARVRSVARDIDADLIHTHSPSLGVATRLFAGTPVLHTEHNIVDSYHPLTRITNRLTYSRNRAVIAVSEAVAASLSGYPGPAPVVIPNGVDVSVPPDAGAAVRDELGLDAATPLVVHVGNIRPGKGHEILVEMAALIANSRPEARVVSLGVEKYEGGLENLRRETKSRGLEKNLQFLGRREDALAFIATADVFVNPSQVEGLPVAVLEAMALARPIVATSVGGVPSVIETGKTGILVEPDDAAALASAVERLLNEPELGKRLGVAAQSLVAEKHGLEPMVRAVEDIYTEILSD